MTIKCTLCNREHDNEVDQFAEHISAYGGVEAWQMWKTFAQGLLARLDAERRAREAAAQAFCESFAEHADRCRPCAIAWQNLKAALATTKEGKL